MDQIKTSEAQRKAQQKYYEKNKDKIYAQRKESGVYKRAYLANYEKHKENKKQKALSHYYYVKGCFEFRTISDEIFG